MKRKKLNPISVYVMILSMIISLFGSLALVPTAKAATVPSNTYGVSVIPLTSSTVGSYDTMRYGVAPAYQMVLTAPAGAPRLKAVRLTLPPGYAINSTYSGHLNLVKTDQNGWANLGTDFTNTDSTITLTETHQDTGTTITDTFAVAVSGQTVTLTDNTAGAPSTYQRNSTATLTLNPGAVTNPQSGNAVQNWTVEGSTDGTNFSALSVVPMPLGYRTSMTPYSDGSYDLRVKVDAGAQVPALIKANLPSGYSKSVPADARLGSYETSGMSSYLALYDKTATAPIPGLGQGAGSHQFTVDASTDPGAVSVTTTPFVAEQDFYLTLHLNSGIITASGQNVYAWNFIDGSSHYIAAPAYVSNGYSVSINNSSTDYSAASNLSIAVNVPSGGHVAQGAQVRLWGYSWSEPTDDIIGSVTLAKGGQTFGPFDVYNASYGGHRISTVTGTTAKYRYKVSVNPVGSDTLVNIEDLNASLTYSDNITARFTFNRGLTNPSSEPSYDFEPQAFTGFGELIQFPGISLTYTTPPSSGGTTSGGGGTITPPSNPGTVNPGGDNTQYNQNTMQQLNNVTPQQQQAAQLPSTAPVVSPTASAPVTLTTSDGLSITVPPQAVASETAPVKFTVAVGTVTTPPKAESTAVVLDPVKYQRSFGIEGKAEGTVTFSAPVTVSFPVRAADLPSGVTPQQLAVYYWDAERGDWQKVGGVYDPVTNTVSAPVFHFSTYALMADTSAVPNRLSGADRFATANAVANQGWKAGAKTVVLTNAYGFADALVAAPLAFKNNAPVLLTDANTLTPSTLAEIQKLSPKQIILIGGTGVISQAIQDSLSAGYGANNVVRYSGVDRYATAAAVATAMGSSGKAAVFSGDDSHFPDALAMSSYAAYNGIPILFTEQNTLPEATAQALTTQKVTSTIVAGGTGAVSEAVLAQLPAAVRYGGADRYETATIVAAKLHMNLNRTYVVTGLDFPDALVAGALAAQSLSPIVMVDDTVPSTTSSFLMTNKASIGGLTLIGGEGVITPSQETGLRGALK